LGRRAIDYRIGAAGGRRGLGDLSH
jgi:hypothetical protein